MLVKLRFLISKCDPLRTSCASITRNAGKVAFSDFQARPSAEIVSVHRSLNAEQVDLLQVVLYRILKQRS